MGYEYAYMQECSGRCGGCSCLFNKMDFMLRFKEKNRIIECKNISIKWALVKQIKYKNNFQISRSFIFHKI